MHELGCLVDNACEHGDTGREIAKRAGVQYDLVSGLRNGTYRATPTVARVEAILNALDYSLQIVLKKDRKFTMLLIGRPS